MSPPCTLSSSEVKLLSRVEGRFYIIMATVMAAIAVAGFGPGLVVSAHRKAPLTFAVGAHGFLFATWLLLFLTQAILVHKRRFNLHRRLGYAGAILAIVMVVSGFVTSLSMAQRGFDLSGDLIGDVDPTSDVVQQMIFQLGDLVNFGILVGVAILYRRRPDVHKRLMLLATVGGLMPAALAHVIGHSPFLRGINAPIILIPFVMLLFAGVVHDRVSTGRIHPVSLWVALALFALANLRAVVIGPSDAWRQIVVWLTQ